MSHQTGECAYMIVNISRFNTEERTRLVRANILMLSVIVLHDADHLRQAVGWCYTIPAQIWLLNILVYVPNTLALLLVWRGHRLCALGTAIGGALISVLFLKVHLWKSGLPLWGVWNRSYFELHVDWLSWCILGAVALTGAAVFLVGLLTEARSSFEHPAIPW